MKQLMLTMLGLVLVIFSVSAQIPERAEDISPLLIGKTKNIDSTVLKKLSNYFEGQYIDTSGKIEFEYINPNYKIRLGAALLLAVLNELMKPELEQR